MSYITTRSGQFVDFLNPDLDTINIEDIAHALALTNRYSGHTPYPYSVAQHSVLASRVAPPGLELEALLHDAHEAYVGDMTTPLKSLIPDYKAIEDRMEDAVREKFGLPAEFDPRVKEIDRRMLATEAQAFNFTLWVGIADVVPYNSDLIAPWDWHVARDWFLRRFEELKKPTQCDHLNGICVNYPDGGYGKSPN